MPGRRTLPAILPVVDSCSLSVHNAHKWTPIRALLVNAVSLRRLPFRIEHLTSKLAMIFSNLSTLTPEGDSGIRFPPVQVVLRQPCLPKLRAL